jgi:hypothetical protein
MTESINVLAINVGGLGNKTDYVVYYARKRNYKIVFISELKLYNEKDQNQFKMKLLSLGFVLATIDSTGNSAWIIDSKLSFSINKINIDKTVSICIYSQNNISYNLIGIHGLHNEKLNFWKKILNFSSSLTNPILIGDFNLQYSKPCDQSSLDLISHFNFIPIFSGFETTRHKLVVQNSNFNLQESHLDHIWISHKINNATGYVNDFDPGLSHDHFPITLILQTELIKFKDPTPKLNRHNLMTDRSSILENNLTSFYSPNIDQHGELLQKTTFDTLVDLYGLSPKRNKNKPFFSQNSKKLKIRFKNIVLFLNLTKKNNSWPIKIAFFLKKIQFPKEIENLILSNEPNNSLIFLIKTVKKQIKKDFYDSLEKDKNSQIQTAIDKLNSDGDKLNAQFFNRVRNITSPSNNLPLTTILVNNEITSDPNKIKNEIKNFYFDLYNSPRLNSNQSLITKENIRGSPTLTLPLITFEIVQSFINKLPNNKATGPDQIPYEFLKKAPLEFINDLTSFFNRILIEKKIPKSWKKSEISLLFKSGDPKSISNYRPIALLNTFYKLFTNILNQHLLKQCLQKNLFSKSQLGFMPGRSTIENVSLLCSIIEINAKHKSHLYIAFCDFMKAFDSISHKVLEVALKDLNACPDLIDLIKNIYSDSTCHVATPFGNTDSFKTSFGVKQGDPLSPLLFNLVINRLLLDLEKENGFQFQGMKLSVLSYADDIAILASSPHQLQNLLNVLSNFCISHQLKLNVSQDKSKTAIMTTDNDPNLQFTIYPNTLWQTNVPILRNFETYKYLGFNLNINLDWSFHINKLIQPLFNVINLLKFKSFSFMQCIQIWNMVILPKLRYSMNIIWFENKINSIFRAFHNLLFFKLSLKGWNSYQYFLISKKNNGPNLIHPIKPQVEAFFHTWVTKGLNSTDNRLSFILQFMFKKRRFFFSRFNAKLKKLNLSIIENENFDIHNSQYIQHVLPQELKPMLKKLPQNISTFDNEKFIWTDGSKSNNISSFAIVSDNFTFKSSFEFFSSYYMELLAIAITSYKWSINSISNLNVISDSLSAILSIRKAIKRKHIKFSNKNLISAPTIQFILNNLKKTNFSFKLHHIHSHLLDEDCSKPPEKIAIQKNLDSDYFGEIYDNVALGNKYADEIAGASPENFSSFKLPFLQKFLLVKTETSQTSFGNINKKNIPIENLSSYILNYIQNDILNKKKENLNFLNNIDSNPFFIPNSQKFIPLGFKLLFNKLPTNDKIHEIATLECIKRATGKPFNSNLADLFEKYPNKLCDSCDYFNEDINHLFSCQSYSNFFSKIKSYFESLLGKHNILYPYFVFSTTQFRSLCSGAFPSQIFDTITDYYINIDRTLPNDFKKIKKQIILDTCAFAMNQFSELWKLRNTYKANFELLEAGHIH